MQFGMLNSSVTYSSTLLTSKYVCIRDVSSHVNARVNALATCTTYELACSYSQLYACMSYILSECVNAALDASKHRAFSRMLLIE